MIDGKELMPEISRIFKEGVAVASERRGKLLDQPELSICQKHEVPYESGTLSEMAFMFGFASCMSGLLAAAVVSLNGSSPPDYTPSNN